MKHVWTEVEKHHSDSPKHYVCWNCRMIKTGIRRNRSCGSSQYLGAEGYSYDGPKTVKYKRIIGTCDEEQVRMVHDS